MYYFLILMIVFIILAVIHVFRNAPVIKQWDDILEDNKNASSKFNGQAAAGSNNKSTSPDSEIVSPQTDSNDL